MKQTITIEIDVPEDRLDAIVETLTIVYALDPAEIKIKEVLEKKYESLLDTHLTLQRAHELLRGNYSKLLEEKTQEIADLKKVGEEQSKKLAELCTKYAKLEQQNGALNGMLHTVTHFRDLWQKKAEECLAELKELKGKTKKVTMDWKPTVAAQADEIGSLRKALADRDKMIFRKNSIIADLIGTLKSESSYLAKAASAAHEANQK